MPIRSSQKHYTTFSFYVHRMDRTVIGTFRQNSKQIVYKTSLLISRVSGLRLSCYLLNCNMNIQYVSLCMLRKWSVSGRGDQDRFCYRAKIPNGSFLLLRLGDPSTKNLYLFTRKPENWWLSTTLTSRGSMWEKVGDEKSGIQTGTNFPVYIEAILLGFCGIFVQ